MSSCPGSPGSGHGQVTGYFGLQTLGWFFPFNFLVFFFFSFPLFQVISNVMVFIFFYFLCFCFSVLFLFPLKYKYIFSLPQSGGLVCLRKVLTKFIDKK